MRLGSTGIGHAKQWHRHLRIFVTMRFLKPMFLTGFLLAAVVGRSDIVVRSLIPSDLSAPHAVAVDDSGNIFIADTNHNEIRKWSAATGRLTTLVSGLYLPAGVAVDNLGNVYISDTYPSAVEIWSA